MTSADCTDYIMVVHSVHLSADSPAARRDALKLANLKAALAAARLARRVMNRLDSRDADAEELCWWTCVCHVVVCLVCVRGLIYSYLLRSFSRCL